MQYTTGEGQRKNRSSKASKKVVSASQILEEKRFYLVGASYKKLGAFPGGP